MGRSLHLGWSQSIIYGFFGHTYGVSLDTKVLGVKHGAFTLNEDGGERFFTMPMEDVECKGRYQKECQGVFRK
jgi:hypothetical protein